MYVLEKNPKSTEKEIKYSLLLLVSFVNSLNISVIFLLLQLFQITNIRYQNIITSSDERFNGAITYFLIFYLPFIVINYLLIFRNNRYLELSKKYSTPKYKYGNVYILGVVSISLLSVLIHGILIGNLFKI